MNLIDTHAHLDNEQFSGDLADILGRSAAAGVSWTITIGTTVESSRRAVELAARFPTCIRAAVGIQPNYVAEARDSDWAEIVKLARSDGVVAIGETGLDRFWDHAPSDLQVEYFRRHIELARESGLPLVIHNREADADIIACLESSSPVSGVMHSFTGAAATASRCLELGLYLSFAGMVTFKNQKFNLLREVARVVPHDRILVETDSPYLCPEPYRGDRNEPARVELTARRLAELRGEPFETFAAQTTRNARQLFQLS